jgi:hypothetical protein
MPAGVIMMTVHGDANVILTGNPVFSHFRHVYRRATPFAMERINLPFRYVPHVLANDQDTVLRCKVDRVADALGDCYLVFDLPDVWSPVRNVEGTLREYAFQWIEHIGFNMIRSVCRDWCGNKGQGSGVVS